MNIEQFLNLVGLNKETPLENCQRAIHYLEKEIKEIIERLESTETNLEDSMEQYDRMLQLNHHIQDQFRQKAKKIKKSTFSHNKKDLSNI